MQGGSEAALAAARFGARPRKGVLLGLSGPRLATLGVAALVLTAGLFTAGLSGALVAAPVVAVLAATAFVPVAGATAVEWLPVAGHWALRRMLRQDVYGARPLAPRPAGTLALPGDAAALRVFSDQISGAAMVHDPHRRTLTVTCVVEHPSFVLLGAEEQNRRVVGWGRVLASAARSGLLAAVQVMEATLPDHGTAVLDWWTTHGHHQPSAGQRWAAATYGQFVAAAAPSSARHRTTLSLSLDIRRAGRAIARSGGGLPAAAAVLRGVMAATEIALRAADLTPRRWLAEAELAHLVRAAYDPTGATATETSRLGRQLHSAGPVGIREHWAWLHADSAVSAVLWVSEWPRAQAYPNFLAPLILAPGVRKTLTLVAKPIAADAARRDIRRQKVEYVTDAEHKARLGQVADYTDAAEYQDLLAREQQLAVGHADLRFAGLIAVTAPDKPALDAAVAQIEQAAIQAECETRLLVGQQTQAFTAAALPLGRGL